MAPRLNRPVLVGTLMLAVYAGAVLGLGRPHTPVAALNTAFYLLLLLNTYFSVSFTEAVFKVRCRSDAAVSTVLVGLYLALPWSVDVPSRFFLLMALFFSLAVVKYANWLTRIDAGFFLRRKIMANSCGAAMGILTAGALALWDRPLWVTAIALAAYAYGNLHTLLLDPLYRLR
ncbi:MAG TPA: hypothetical protein VM243_00535 [Phycisphaerae bacterium]|nr:hypothetical protein [Phycisphaerae bacterium]